MRTGLILRLILLCLVGTQSLPAQFGKVVVTLDQRLLKENDRQELNTLSGDIERLFSHTPWGEDYNDLAIPLQIQIVFQGSAYKGGTKTYLAQGLFTNGIDLRYFDKAVQFHYYPGGSLYYDPVIFEPLVGFLVYYGNLILASEIDTYQPLGGTRYYEECRTLALRGVASDYPKGWSTRLNLTDDVRENYDLRKARFAYYYARDLFQQNKPEAARQQFEVLLKNLESILQKFPRSHTVYFLKAHAPELNRTLTTLGQTELLKHLARLDPANKEIYFKGLEIISK